MAIWRIDQDSKKYQGLFVKNPQDSLVLGDLHKTQPLANTWVPLEVVDDAEVYQGLKVQPIWGISNFPGLYIIQAWDQRAVDILKPLIANQAEILPLKHPTSIYYAIHIIEVIRCLDYDRSEFTYWMDGNIRKITKFVFKDSCLDGKHMFTFAEGNYSDQFVSDEFKCTVEENNLVGLVFTPVNTGT
jgi:hypothetical protein